MIDPDSTQLEYISLDEATIPLNGVSRCYSNYWWAVHPERGIIIWHRSASKVDVNGHLKWSDDGSIQCNQDRRVTEKVASSLYPWAEIKMLPVVYLRRF